MLERTYGQVVLPAVEREFRDQCRQARDGRGLPHGELRLSAESGGSEILLPVETRGLGVEVLAAPVIVGFLHVENLDARGMRGGNFLFQQEDTRGLAFRILDAGQREHLGEM